MGGRKSFTKFQHEEALERQNNKCDGGCGVTFFTEPNKVRPHYDHKDEDNSNNTTENCQALCPNCHDRKSREENVKRSSQKQNEKFVSCCPLCCTKSEPVNSNQKTICDTCESIYKVMRYDPKVGKTRLTGKKLTVVRACPHCGWKDFEKPEDTNTWLNCPKCKKSWAVWIQKYKEKSGWW